MNFDEWFDSEYPAESSGERPKYRHSSVMTLMQSAWKAATAAERDECKLLADNYAAFCEEHDNHYGESAAKDISDNIAERSNAKFDEQETKNSFVRSLSNVGLEDACKKCGGLMKPGKAIAQTWTGLPDFPGDKHCVTLSPGGSGKLIDCMKCEKCGWSMTSANELNGG